MDSSFKVGEYEIAYDKKELSNNLPLDIFFNFKGSFPFIYVENFLTPIEVNRLAKSVLDSEMTRGLASVHDYSTGKEVHKVDTSGRKTFNLFPSQTSFELLNTILDQRIIPTLHQFYDIKGRGVRRETWQFLGYEEGFFFNPHCDNCMGGSTGHDPAHRDKVWQCNQPGRKFTVLLYLNSHGVEYQGGSLVLPRITLNGKPIRFDPKAGALIAFPSNFYFTHEVQRVLSGYRMSCVTWVDVEKI